ncbi:MAG: hypothetical protein U1A78_28675 [Polyangia bacterium]
MSEPAALSAAPSEFTALGELARAAIGPSLQALLLFGSCLSAGLRQPGSIPDLLALVDDLDAALRHLGCGRLQRALGRTLPPLTLALVDPRAAACRGVVLAKLNVVTMATAQRAVAGLPDLPDLYLAGRLSKPVALLVARDAHGARAAAALHRDALEQLIDRTLRGLARDTRLVDAVDAVIGLSYRGEVRPEGAEKIAALRRSFPDFYQYAVPAVIAARAAACGFTLAPLEPDHALLRDGRTAAQRRQDRRAVARLLRRSRWRAVLRWPRQLVVYRGALGYVLGKLMRVRRQRGTAAR